MAKSTRSKTKRTFRRAKREEGVFAATHAARLERLSQKLATIAQTSVKKTPINEDEEEKMEDEQGGLEDQDALAAMDIDSKSKVSTHGRRLSRRQEWRAARGLPDQKKTGKLNRQGVLGAARRAGRSKRRR